MRRFKSNDIGFVGAQAFSGNLDLKNGFSLHDLPSAYLSEAMKVNLLIRRITPQPLLNPATAPDEFSRIFGGMMVYMEPIGKIADLIDKEYENKGLTQPQPPEKYDCVTPKLLRDKRAELMKNIGELNKLLIKYYQNDKRVHLPILHLISLLNRGVERIDEIYRNKRKGRKNAGDLGDLRENMSRHAFEVKAGGKKIAFTGTHYESYLQIYKTPEKAVEKYDRLNKLLDRDENDLSPAEKKELAKLERMDDLAEDFDNAHNYMLDKQGYRQQDIDYAFDLGKREKAGGATGEMFRNHKSASDTYKAVFLEKIFGGMKDRAAKDPEQGRVSDEVSHSSVLLKEWLDQDMSTAAERKLNGLRMIIKGLKRSMDDPDREQLYNAVRDLFLNSWFPAAWPAANGGDNVDVAGNLAPMAFEFLMNDRSKKSSKIIMSIVNLVLEQGRDDSLAQAKKEAGRK